MNRLFRTSFSPPAVVSSSSAATSRPSTSGHACEGVSESRDRRRLRRSALRAVPGRSLARGSATDHAPGGSREGSGVAAMDRPAPPSLRPNAGAMAQAVPILGDRALGNPGWSSTTRLSAEAFAPYDRCRWQRAADRRPARRSRAGLQPAPPQGHGTALRRLAFSSHLGPPATRVGPDPPRDSLAPVSLNTLVLHPDRHGDVEERLRLRGFRCNPDC
jgi:hypothetical protein